jgi:protein SCO1/2
VRTACTRGAGGTPPHQPAGRRRSALLIAVLALAMPLFAEDAPPNISIAQKLNTQIPLDLMMRDESGKVVRLNQYFNHGRPVILNFVYYRCPMLCPMVLEGTTTALTELKFNIGEQFDVITVSIDPRDQAKDAALLKEKYIRHYGRLSAAGGWHFLTAHETAIKTLTDAVGFQFEYDSRTDQFAHGAALMVLTPDGRMSRYFYGFEFRPRDLRLAIVEASEGKVGNITDQFLLLCFHYDPTTGKYSRNAMMFARAGGVTTMFVLGGFIFVMFRKERALSKEPRQ